MTEWEKMMADVQSLGQVLQKAQQVNDAGADNDDAGGDDANDADGFLKSFRVKLDDGTETDAYDAVELVKALHGNQEQLTKALTTLKGEQGEMAKALQAIPTLLKTLTETVQAQGEMLKALREEPAGRRSATVVPKEPAKPPVDKRDILAKALAACKEEKIGSADVAIIEHRLLRDLPVQPELLKAIGVAA